MEIKKVYKESVPQVKLIGKRLTNNDRDENGTFARYWQQSFREGWFDILRQCKGLPGVGDDYLGAMHGCVRPVHGGAERTGMELRWNRLVLRAVQQFPIYCAG